MWRLESTAACEYQRRPAGATIRLWLAALVSLIRSRTLVYAFAVSALGVYLVVTGGKVTDITVPIRLGISAYLLALATYLYNDITDYKTDLVNKRATVYSLGDARQRMTRYYTLAFFAISTILAFSINYYTGIASLGFSSLAVLYSHPRTNLKSMFVVKTAVTGAGGFLVGMMGCFSSGGFSYLGLLASVIPFCFYFILGPLGDISDMKGDKEDGRRTFPIIIGVKKSLLVTVASIFAILSIFLISNMILGISAVGVGLGIIVTGFMLSRIASVSKKYQDKNELRRCRRSIRYCIFACQVSLMIGAIIAGIP